MACFEIDGDGRIGAWTSTAEQLAGWPAARANGRRVDDLLIAHSSLSGYHAELAVLEIGGSLAGWLRVSVNHWDGRQVPVGLALTRHPGAQVRVVMRPGEALRTDETLDALLADRGKADGAVVCDASGHLVAMTGVLAEIFGPAEGRAEDGSWAARVGAISDGSGRRVTRYTMPLVRALRGERFRDSHLVVDPIDGPRRLLLATGRPLSGPEFRGLGALVVSSQAPLRPAACRCWCRVLDRG